MITAILVIASGALGFFVCAAIVSGQDRRHEEEDLRKWTEERRKKGEK